MITVSLLAWNAANLIAGFIVFGMTARFMAGIGHVRMNESGRAVPASLGAGYILLTILMSPAAAWVSMKHPDAFDFIEQVLIIVCGFGFIGLLEDIAAQRRPARTSGPIRLFFGFAVAFLVATLNWRNRGPVMMVADTFIITLAANAFNLLGDRPGRAIKTFFLPAFLIMFGSLAGFYFVKFSKIMPVTWFLAGPFMVWSVSGALIDFRRGGALGSAGSNVLGAMLGMIIVWELSNPLRLVCLAAIIAFNILAAAIPPDLLIEKISPLKRLDSLFISPGHTL